MILRNKRRGLLTGDRPWSVSGLPQLMAMSVGSLPTGVAAGELSQFSISESALHQLASPATSTPTASKAEGLCEMMASSSTVEESVAHTTCAGSSSGAGSLRRRKMRSRKRTVSNARRGFLTLYTFRSACERLCADLASPLSTAVAKV